MQVSSLPADAARLATSAPTKDANDRQSSPDANCMWNVVCLADYLKVLYYDGSGMCLFAKRLENGRFVWPPIVDGQMTLTPAQLALLLEAMDWRRTVAIEPPRKPVMV